MKKTLFTAFCILLLNTGIYKAFAQGRNAIAVGAGINFPFKNGYSIGRSRVLQAQFFAKKRWAFAPVLGWDTYNEGLPANLVFLNFSAKYFIGKNIFTFAGPSAYAGGNGDGVAGVGGTLGGGYDWDLDGYSSLELSARADFLPAYINLPAVAGLRLAYKFHFKHKGGQPSRFDYPIK